MPDYYLNREAEEICLIDYVQDDMKDADALITAPERPSAPSWWNYDTTAEYDAAYAAYEVAYQAYEEAYEAYLNKLGRDELREELEEKTINYSIYTLCFFDGTEEVMLTDTFVGDHYYSNCSTATDAPVITYTAYNQSTLDKVKLSKISSIYDIEEMVRAALFSSSDRYVAIKGNATVIDQKDGTLLISILPERFFITLMKSLIIRNTVNCIGFLSKMDPLQNLNY